MKESIIGVIGGLGHIGLIQAACLAKIGYKTIAYDIDTMKIENVLKGELPFIEQELTELLMETVSMKLLNFTSNIKDLQDADIVFVCVGTPSLPSGEADLSQLYSAVELLAQNINSHCLAVIKSTVPVGTSRKVTEYLTLNKLSDKLTMVSNPEFLRKVVV